MTEATVTEVSVTKGQIIPWWLILLEGLAALIIGIFLLMSPVRTTIFLVQVLGWYWLITGILTLIMLFLDRSDAIWKIISGAIGIIAGLLIISYPLYSAALVPGIFIMVVGILGICFGIISLFWALKAGWGAAIMGVLSILFGLLLLGNAMVGATILVYLLGFLGIIGGAVAIYMAFQLRSQ